MANGGKNKIVLKGVREFMSALNKEVDKIEGVTMEGLIKAAIIVQNSMDKESPTVPVDTRNLQASFFIVTSTGGKVTGDDSGSASSLIKGGKKGKPIVALGFTANYAVVVHEDIENQKNWNRPGSGPKFLEAALERNKLKIVETIAKNIKL